MKRPAEPPGVAADTDGVLVETFHAVESTMADKLREYSDEVTRLRRENELLLARSSTLVRLDARLKRAREWLKKKIVRQFRQKA